MPQRDTLRGMDAALMAAFISAGLADDAQYLAPGGSPATPIDVEVYLDRDAEIFGDDQASVIGVRTLVTMQLDQVPAPARGANVTVGSESWQLAELLEQDESLSVWVVTRA